MKELHRLPAGPESRRHRFRALTGSRAYWVALIGCVACGGGDPSESTAHAALAPRAPAHEDAPTVAPASAPLARCIARPEADVPARLSLLGCFDGGDPRVLGPELVPFSVNAPLWLDDAEKDCWMALPDGAQIALDSHGDFVLPAGTVLGKTFTVGGARAETRIMMNDENEGWRGYSYRWNADGTDAEIAAAEGEELTGVGAEGQDWTIPGRQSCLRCHTAETHVALGLEVAQLNRDVVDPATGVAGNQLDALIARGVLDGGDPVLATPEARPKLADYRDESQPTEARARAYLAGNCSSCHMSPENICTGDFRWTASGVEMGVCNAQPKIDGAQFGWPDGTLLLAPGDPDRSAIVRRVQAPADAPEAMPPIGRHRIDEKGVALLTEWIVGMSGCRAE